MKKKKVIDEGKKVDVKGGYPKVPIKKKGKKK